jgi:hypothetical protein
MIQPFQQPERVVGFFSSYHQLYSVTWYTLRDIADQFQRWVKERAAKKVLTKHEARRTATTIARLPDLLGKADRDLGTVVLAVPMQRRTR